MAKEEKRSVDVTVLGSVRTVVTEQVTCDVLMGVLARELGIPDNAKLKLVDAVSSGDLPPTARLVWSWETRREVKDG